MEKNVIIIVTVVSTNSGILKHLILKTRNIGRERKPRFFQHH